MPRHVSQLGAAVLYPEFLIVSTECLSHLPVLKIPSSIYLCPSAAASVLCARQNLLRTSAPLTCSGGDSAQYNMETDDEDRMQDITSVGQGARSAGKLEILWMPVAGPEEEDAGKELEDILDPADLLGKPWHAKCTIKGAIDLPLMVDVAYCQYVPGSVKYIPGQTIQLRFTSAYLQQAYSVLGRASCVCISAVLTFAAAHSVQIRLL